MSTVGMLPVRDEPMHAQLI